MFGEIFILSRCYSKGRREVTQEDWREEPVHSPPKQEGTQEGKLEEKREADTTGREERSRHNPN